MTSAASSAEAPGIERVYWWSRDAIFQMKRIEELRLIRHHGLAGFFLIHHDLLELAREVAARAAAVLLIGEAADEFERLFGAAGTRITYHATVLAGVHVGENAMVGAVAAGQQGGLYR